MSRLTAKQREDAKGFLNDLFVSGGLLSEADSPRKSINNVYMNYYQKEAGIVCKEIKGRGFEFDKVDSALSVLTGCRFQPNVHSTFYRGSVKKDRSMLARYIADFCAANKIYWDDVNTNRTTYEMAAYKQSVFGGTLWEYGCFLSQTVKANKANNVTSSTTSGTGASTTSTQRVPGQAPKNPYKSLGPQSGKVRDLQGVAGDKVIKTGPVVYKIIDTNTTTGGKEIRAFIKPLDAKGASGSTNKVFIGSSTGYTDMTCYFTDVVDADAFLQKLVSATGNSNLKVAKLKLDKNGYYFVGTEYGVCAIAAVKLNEEKITEETVVETKQRTKKTYKYDINNIDVYEEAFKRYE